MWIHLKRILQFVTDKIIYGLVQNSNFEILIIETISSQIQKHSNYYLYHTILNVIFISYHTYFSLYIRQNVTLCGSK